MRIPVAPAHHDGEALISRSQAKRLIARIELFKSVLFDFDGVKTVGPAFVDEIFRVFQGAHPDVKLTWANTAPEVERMIRRALRARAETPSG